MSELKNTAGLAKKNQITKPLTRNKHLGLLYFWAKDTKNKIDALIIHLNQNVRSEFEELVQGWKCINCLFKKQFKFSAFCENHRKFIFHYKSSPAGLDLEFEM